MKKIIVLFIALILSAGTAFSHEDDTFQEAKEIIESEIPCGKLTEEQLEHIGDYYMEQMHPGEAHELMDKMMGGEGSESLKQMHTIMAKSLYCDEDISGMMGSGMMGGNMMMPMMRMMMGGGMMNMAWGNNMDYGMMGNFGYGSGYLSFVNLLYIILLIGLIILVYLWIFRLLKGEKNK